MIQSSHARYGINPRVVVKSHWSRTSKMLTQQPCLNVTRHRPANIRELRSIKHKTYHWFVTLPSPALHQFWQISVDCAKKAFQVIVYRRHVINWTSNGLLFNWGSQGQISLKTPMLYRQCVHTKVICKRPPFLSCVRTVLHNWILSHGIKRYGLWLRAIRQPFTVDHAIFWMKKVNIIHIAVLCPFLRLNMVSTSERRRYICNDISHWPGLRSAIHRKRTYMVHLVLNPTECHGPYGMLWAQWTSFELTA